MTLSNYDLAPVKSLIRVLNSGIDFYKKAEHKTSDKRFNQVFERMIGEKVRAIALLQPYVVADEGCAERGSAVSVEIREAYTQLLDLFQSDNLHLYLSQLEELEDKVLEKIEAALEGNLPGQCKSALLQIKARMTLCHNEIRALEVITE
ncbi:PA2169 family four-helix-bundle protein [Pseudoalteromonas fenneropenaei]|uniref:PA2169 family four-helix-bundle protein n=1 Tax=Pseudoalteromonas fenneropenaei TaxID=1737459 RepID=A0ABV7CLT2_9GAMM